MRSVLVLMAAAVLAASCSGEIVGSSTVNGTYTLRTINGAALPVTLSSSGTNSTELLEDAFTLFAGGTYSRARRIRTTTNGVAATEVLSDAGSYVILGTSVTLRSGLGAGETISIYTPNTLTVVLSGSTWVYIK